MCVCVCDGLGGGVVVGSFLRGGRGLGACVVDDGHTMRHVWLRMVTLCAICV